MYVKGTSMLCRDRPHLIMTVWDPSAETFCFLLLPQQDEGHLRQAPEGRLSSHTSEGQEDVRDLDGWMSM